MSPRKVDELVEAVGMRGISQSEVSRICKGLDEVVLGFKGLDGVYPYVWLDGTFPKVREGGRVRHMALVLASSVWWTSCPDPKAMGILKEAEEEVLAYMTVAKGHWQRIHSTNRLERLNHDPAPHRCGRD